MDNIKRKLQYYINYYHMIRAILATAQYGRPSKALKVIGVTGTDGKTTTTSLIYHILRSAGKKASMLSSVYAKIGDKEYDTGLHMTTPDAVLVQKLLRIAADHGDEYFVLETTSHAFHQNRNWGIRYKVGVITNITSEHLDYHKTYKNYLLTKAKIITRSGITLINRDDQSYESLVAYAQSKGAPYKSYGIDLESDFNRDLRRELKLSITDFNNYNYLAAYSVCKTLGISDDVIFKAFKTFVLPKGRMDIVYDKDFQVIIDFAHTTNSFKELLSHLKRNVRGRIIHVFGAAGLRDAQKRSHMGEMSARYADVIIVTEEDYRTEDPKAIAEKIVLGIKEHDFTMADRNELDEKSKKVYTVLMDRHAAITKAISIAKKGDVVVCTGKSHEKSLNRRGREEPWDEYESVRQALKLRSTDK